MPVLKAGLESDTKMSTGFGNFSGTQHLNPMAFSNEVDRNIRTARIGERPIHITHELDGTEIVDDKGSVSELSVNEKMEKPMLPPLEYLSSIHST